MAKRESYGLENIVNFPIKQVPPTDGQTDVLPVLMTYYQMRAAVGKQKYKKPLRTFNGRSATLDALQESMDLSLYLMQKYMEEGEDE